jgi:hypothetical protein
MLVKPQSLTSFRCYLGLESVLIIHALASSFEALSLLACPIMSHNDRSLVTQLWSVFVIMVEDLWWLVRISC